MLYMAVYFGSVYITIVFLRSIFLCAGFSNNIYSQLLIYSFSDLDFSFFEFASIFHWKLNLAQSTLFLGFMIDNGIHIKKAKKIKNFHDLLKVSAHFNCEYAKLLNFHWFWNRYKRCWDACDSKETNIADKK